LILLVVLAVAAQAPKMEQLLQPVELLILEAVVAAVDTRQHLFLGDLVQTAAPVSSYSKCNQLKVDQSLGHTQALVFGNAQQVF
jgi:hypothetical protein